MRLRRRRYVTEVLKDRVVVARERQRSPKCVEHTPHCVAFENTIVLKDVPLGLDKTRKRRGKLTAPLSVAFRYTLFDSDPAVHVQVRFVNQHTEHRLTVEFPTGLSTAETEAGATFDVVKHTAPSMQAFCRDFVSAAAEGHSLTILSKSMHSYDARVDADGLILSKCLLKASGCMQVPLLPHWQAPEGNCIGRLVVQNYALLPGSSSDARGELARRAAEFCAEPFVEHILFEDEMKRPDRYRATHLPSAASLLRVSMPFELTALKRHETRSSLILRVVNWSDQPEELTLELSKLLKVKRVWRTDLRERRGAQVAVRDGLATVSAAPQEIVTLELEK